MMLINMHPVILYIPGFGLNLILKLRLLSAIDKQTHFNNFYRGFILHYEKSSDQLPEKVSKSRFYTVKSWFQQWLQTLPENSQRNVEGELKNRLNVTF
jgi:hypothetical protein